MTQLLELISQALNSLEQGSSGALAALLAVVILGELGVPFPFVLAGALFFVGYQIAQGSVNIIPLVMILIFGEQLGAAIVYWLARLLGNRFIAWLERHFRPIQNQLERAKGRLHSQAPIAVAIGRLIPGLLLPTSLASGVAGVQYKYFALGVALSTFIWCGTFIAFGILAGHGVQYLPTTMPRWLIALQLG